MKIIKKGESKYPNKLLEVESPPKQLYVEGDESLLNNDSIAIVGSRKASSYGKQCAKIFAREISRAGFTVVSGLAIGIDSIAHIYSMNEMGKTIAVLGSGLNNIAPKENYYLYKQILENGGCVVTEYPPEEQENKVNFPRRNRIISGLAMGVLLVEAKYRGGGSITARQAIKQRKEVFCIPNRIDEKNGYSTNLLIKEGANLVTCPQDILDFYTEDLEIQTDKIPDEYKNIYDLISELPISANEIAKILNKPIAEVSQTLSMLEIEGLIQNIPGNKYIRSNKKITYTIFTRRKINV